MSISIDGLIRCLFLWSFFMVFLHGLCLSNSTVKVMKGLPWQIGVSNMKRP